MLADLTSVPSQAITHSFVFHKLRSWISMLYILHIKLWDSILSVLNTPHSIRGHKNSIHRMDSSKKNEQKLKTTASP